jgi:hypothetical protein
MFNNIFFFLFIDKYINIINNINLFSSYTLNIIRYYFILNNDLRNYNVDVQFKQFGSVLISFYISFTLLFIQSISPNSRVSFKLSYSFI